MNNARFYVIDRINRPSFSWGVIYTPSGEFVQVFETEEQAKQFIEQTTASEVNENPALVDIQPEDVNKPQTTEGVV